MSDQAIGTLAVGYGYWGPNIVRNLLERPEFDLLGLCEREEGRIAEFNKRTPGIPCERDFETALADPLVEAVAIATPPAHSLRAGSPGTRGRKARSGREAPGPTAGEAAELIELANELDQVLMPGHTFLYSPSVNKVKALIDEEVLGEIYFATSSRMNLGLYQQDGVILDLAPHDLSILLYWLGKPLVEVTANGRCVFQEGVHGRPS